MPRSNARLHRALGALAAIALTTSVAACSTAGSTSTGSSGGGGGSAAAGGTYTIWDPYPQFDNSSAWVQLLDKCGSAAGVSVKRTAYDTTSLTSKELLAAQQGVSPDVLIVDNPVVSTLASAGVLTTTAQTHVDTSTVESNILAAGQINGSTYGVPIGANTLALYYNKSILKAAGVDPTTITNWATLTAALAKVKAVGKTGITF
ncbi:MAG TPA: extracellular solute-binding protein, partial [Actinospica sp.]|nr:extracellular solute-binding protein [Actinospica sp.]